MNKYRYTYVSHYKITEEECMFVCLNATSSPLNGWSECKDYKVMLSNYFDCDLSDGSESVE